MSLTRQDYGYKHKLRPKGKWGGVGKIYSNISVFLRGRVSSITHLKQWCFYSLTEYYSGLDNMCQDLFIIESYSRFNTVTWNLCQWH